MTETLLNDYNDGSSLVLRRVNYTQLERTLRSLGKQEGVLVTDIGESDGIVFDGSTGMSTYFGERHDIGKRSIYAIDIEPSKSKKGQFFIVAGHHPVEPAGPVAAIQFVNELLQSNSPSARILRDHYQVTVVPMVDVDYFSLPVKRRIYTTSNNHYNSLDCEEFYSWDQWRVQGAGPEAKAVAKLFRERTRDVRAFTFDLHESWYESKFEPRHGFFIFQYEDTEKSGFAKIGLDAVRNANLPVSGIETECNIRRSFSGMFTAYAEKLGHLGFTQESVTSIRGKRVHRAVRANMHLVSMDAVIREVMNGNYFDNHPSLGENLASDERKKVVVASNLDGIPTEKGIITGDELTDALQNELAGLGVSNVEIVREED